MSEALERIRANVAARTAAAPPMPPPAAPAPVQPPADPVAPPQDAGAQDQRLADVEQSIADLADRVAALEGAGIEDAMNRLTDWGSDESMMAASLPEPRAASAEADA